jgi:glycosyltransferase involved in cell wall biosynthesis
MRRMADRDAPDGGVSDAGLDDERCPVGSPQASSPPDASAGELRKIVFIATEDWFFASHFLPMARAARELGLAVVVVTRVRSHRGVIEAAGARVVAFEAERGSLNPLSLGYGSGRLAAILRRERPAIVHCIALRAILVGGAAAAMAGVPRRVYAVTGMGFLGARSDAVGRLGAAAIRRLVRALETKQTHYVFENASNPLLFGLRAAADPRVTIVGGAGVDPEVWRPAAPPPQPPLRIAVVARMLWSKGIDVAVAAAGLAQAKGARVELSLFGARDPSNPKAIPERTLRDWNGETGIAWHGPTDDVAQVWREHHVCCVPSRGGEGVPRSLLEGAACGRALVTTDVPGCREFVRDGVEGLVVRPGDASALAEAFCALAADPDLTVRLGAAARARVFEGFTERDVMDSVKRLYGRLLETP